MKGLAKGLKADLFFEVHWVGQTIPSWEPWSRIRSTLKLHEFLRAHKTKAVRNLVPAIFVEPKDQIFSDSDDDQRKDIFSDDDDGTL